MIDYAVRINDMEDLVLTIKHTSPGVVWFNVDRKNAKLLVLYVETGKWETIMYLFGHCFLMALLAHYEQDEDYEKCAGIIDAVHAHNRLANDSLPTMPTP